MDFGIQFAKSQAIAIAKDRVAHIAPDNKSNLLALIDLTLDQWKWEQAQPDDTILIEADAFGLGLLGFSSAAIPLAELALTKPRLPKRIPAKDLRPEQCAGPFVQCKSDLFAKLWLDNYPPVRKITDQSGAGLDTVSALLVERDGDSMPAHSLAAAVRQIWIAVWERTKAYREILSEQDAHRAELSAAVQAARDQKREQLDAARASSAAKRTAERAMRDKAIFDMAIDIYLTEGFPKADYVAAVVFDTVKGMDGFQDHTKIGIRERIKGARDEAMRRVRPQP